jgi:hypothetical protein
MDQKAIKLEARLSALEYFVAEQFKMFYTSIGATPAMVEGSHQKLRDAMTKWTIPGAADPVQADMATGELQEAYERLLGIIMNAVVEGVSGGRNV